LLIFFEVIMANSVLSKVERIKLSSIACKLTRSADSFMAFSAISRVIFLYDKLICCRADVGDVSSSIFERERESKHMFIRREAVILASLNFL